MKTPYNQVDHSHCWESKNPPCGQKIEHYKCCLCEKLNPKVTHHTEQIKREAVEEERERIEKIHNELVINGSDRAWNEDKEAGWLLGVDDFFHLHITPPKDTTNN